jgi:hypothetical protein
MYTFAFSEDLPDPTAVDDTEFVVSAGYVEDRSDEAMWQRDLDPRSKFRNDINPVTGIPDQL